MEIIHRVCLSAKQHAKTLKKIQKFGVEIQQTGNGKVVSLNTFEISENSPVWKDVSKVLALAEVKTITTRTEFTEEEISGAEWVRVRPGHIWGYPMPDLDGNWKAISFNAGKECSVCGIGREQIALIQLKSEPKMGKNHFMAINWTFDLFSRPEVINTMLREGISGFEEMKVVHHKSMESLKTVRQLKILNELPSGMINDNLTRISLACNHVKYLGLSRGTYKFSRDAFNEATDLVRSHEWFGSGHQALQLVFASSKFVNLYLENKWKGLYLAPIELID